MRLPSRFTRGLALALVGFLALVYLTLAAPQPPTATSLTVESIAPDTHSSPSQPAKPVPTRSVEPQLIFGHMICVEQHILVYFLAVRLPENASDYGAVEYLVNEQRHRAEFVRRTGQTAHYIDLLPAQPGRYDVTAGRVKIDDLVLELSNPHAVRIEHCRDETEPTRTAEPTRTPRATETAGPTRTPRTPEPSRTPPPTRTPRPTLSPIDMALILGEIECEEGEVQVQFVVVHVPETITAEQLAETKVKYSLKHAGEGEPTTSERTAAFVKLSGDTAHYVDRLPGARGVYMVTAASLTIGDKTLSLHNPNIPYGIRECGPRPTPRATETHSPEITRTPGPTRTATSTRPAEITRTPTATRTITPTRPAEITRTPSPTRTPTATRPPGEPRGAILAEASKTATGARDGDKAKVRGEICVTNVGSETTDDLKIVDQVQYRVGEGEFRNLEEAKLTLEPDDIAPRGRRCVGYSIEFTPIPGAMYRNTAHITIENHVGHMDEEFGPTVRESFGLP